jgi:large subunit ribosomal protein L17
MPGTRKLGRASDHRDAMLRNMVTSLLENGKMTTTVTRAKEVRAMAEKMITLAKVDSLHNKRQALAYITKEDVVKVISDNSAVSGDDVCYFTASGQTDKALQAYNKLLGEGGDPTAIVRSLMYHFMKLITAAALVEKGVTLDGAVGKITPQIIFFRKSSFKNQVAIWSKDRLMDALERLYVAERDCKTTNMPAEEMVSYLIMQLSSAANKMRKSSYCV